MRPLETLLVSTNFLTFVVLAIPRIRTASWAGLLPLTALVMAVVQVSLERYRWQMVPAYALTGVLLLAWLWQRLGPHQPVHWVLVGGTVAIGVLGLLVSTVLPVILPAFSFPLPTGPYAIGTLTYHWVDAGRPELFTPEQDDLREVMVQL